MSGETWAGQPGFRIWAGGFRIYVGGIRVYGSGFSVKRLNPKP
jgi:hypothetical protein